MKVYNYSEIDGRFLGCEEANESPLEPGVYLIPAHATTVEPPEFDEQHIPIWNGVEWELKDISLNTPPIEVKEEAKPDQPKTQAELILERLSLLEQAINDIILGEI